MDKPTSLPRLLEWSLATFHTSFFLVLLLTLLYLVGGLGSLLGSLNTLIGILLFGVLWVTTWWSSRRALRNMHGLPLGRARNIPSRLYHAALLGGINGILFLGALLVYLVTTTLVSLGAQPENILPAVWYLVFATVVGSLVAFAIGAIVGLLLGIVDGALWEASRYIVLSLQKAPNQKENQS